MLSMNHARTRAGPGPLYCNSSHPSIHTRTRTLLILCWPHPFSSSVTAIPARARAPHSCFPSDVDKWRLTEMTTSLLMFKSDTTEDGEKRKEDWRTGREEDEGGCGSSTRTRLCRARCCEEQQQNIFLWRRQPGREGFCRSWGIQKQPMSFSQQICCCCCRAERIIANVPKEFLLVMHY